MTLLEQILAPGALRTVVQPIYSVQQGGLKVRGVECLTRGPSHTNAQNAGVLFEYVRLRREEARVDRACILSALKTARGLPGDLHLNLNAHASTLARDPLFVSFFAEAAACAGIELERVTLELVEHSPAMDGVSFFTSVADLRALGVRIALDDVGVGSSNLGMMLDCHPHYLKVDRHFVSNCEGDDGRLAIIEAITMLARRLGAEVVAEGVERIEELHALTRAGVRLIQGYLACPPMTVAELVQSSKFFLPCTAEAA
jgi:EAL domain-containing protein (putative c-di-GMP-specific phosphodiesterase class I)